MANDNRKNQTPNKPDQARDDQDRNKMGEQEGLRDEDVETDEDSRITQRNDAQRGAREPGAAK